VCLTVYSLEEVRDIDDSQSPDIGPPPVSRFESEAPIAFDPNPTSEDLIEQDVEGEPHLPTNLETRRKRRESGPQPRRVSLFDSPLEALDEEAKKTVRAGAKRKFSVQEDEEKSKPQAEPFRFSRKNTPSQSENTGPNEQACRQSSERPVLGSSKYTVTDCARLSLIQSEPVNTDPVLSPKKQRSVVTEKTEKKPHSKSTRSRFNITRDIQPAPPPLEVLEPIPTTNIVLDSLPPNTPAPDDIFSPPSAEPSTARPESKDTPPPGDLALSSQSGIGGRPARRVRAQVSYKEPSLNTKMRRPGKELVDAVLSDQSQRTGMDPQIAPLTVGKVSIKQEPDNALWKPLGAIGSRSGEEEGEVGSPLRQKLDRREGVHDARADGPRLNSAAASQAISAMIEETRRKSFGANGKGIIEPPGSALEATCHESKVPAVNLNNKDDLAIFDFNESSPPTTIEPSATSSRPRVDLAKAARSVRRHSAVPAPLASKSEGRHESEHKKDESVPTVHKRTASGSTRISSTSSMGLGRSAAVAREKERAKRGIGAGDGPADLHSSSNASSVPLQAKLENDAISSLRADRAASRRKSMML
jgi:hypothetical protein